MPKMKTNSSAKKRFKVTGTGKIKRKHAYKSHILTKKTTKQKRRGRPKKGSDKIKGIRLDMRLETSEKEGFRAAAELSGLDLSAWIRERLRRAAWEELKRAGQPIPFLPAKGREAS